MRGKILGNRYRIQNRIGEGGMANVYLAVDEKLQRKVAIKVMHEHMARNPELRRRFFQEAQAISALDHPNILKIYDYSGEDSEVIWMAMEVLHGHTLSDFVASFKNSRLNPVLASCFVREILNALKAAHLANIVHRDVKPDNIMILNNGRIKLMDFGIAKNMQGHSMTLTGTFMGSPSYMSPEQVRGRQVDARSDLYSLGVLFYEITTGRLPFRGNSTHDIIIKICEGQFIAPRNILPHFPHDLDQIICKAMNLHPSQRYQSAESFARDIDIFLEHRGFEESNIELERYFRDRKQFEKRLKHAEKKHQREATDALAQQGPDEKIHHAPTKTRLNVKLDPQVSHQSSAQTVAVNKSRNDHITAPHHQKSQKVHQDLRPHIRYAKKHVTIKPKEPRGQIVSNVLGIAVVGLTIAATLWLAWHIIFVWPNPLHDAPKANINRPKVATPSQKPRLSNSDNIPATSNHVHSLPKTNNELAKNKNPIKNTTPPPSVDNLNTADKVTAPDHTPKRPKSKRLVQSHKQNHNTPAKKSNATAHTINSQGGVNPPVKNSDQPLPKGYGKIKLQSQPAAQIYKGNKLLGTTVDQTFDSGWISLPSGTHTITLKRQGYKPYKKVINVQANQKMDIPLIRLQKIRPTLNASAPTTIQVVTNKPRAKLIIYKKQGSQKIKIKSDTLSSHRQMVTLDPGDYILEATWQNKTVVKWLQIDARTQDYQTIELEFKD